VVGQTKKTEFFELRAALLSRPLNVRMMKKALIGQKADDTGLLTLIRKLFTEHSTSCCTNIPDLHSHDGELPNGIAVLLEVLSGLKYLT